MHARSCALTLPSTSLHCSPEAFFSSLNNVLAFHGPAGTLILEFLLVPVSSWVTFSISLGELYYLFLFAHSSHCTRALGLYCCFFSWHFFFFGPERPALPVIHTLPILSALSALFLLLAREDPTHTHFLPTLLPYFFLSLPRAWPSPLLPPLAHPSLPVHPFCTKTPLPHLLTFLALQETPPSSMAVPSCTPPPPFIPRAWEF